MAVPARIFRNSAKKPQRKIDFSAGDNSAIHRRFRNKSVT
jgi:hypothetical protein